MPLRGVSAVGEFLVHIAEAAFVAMSILLVCGSELNTYCVQNKHPLLFSCITLRNSNRFV